MQRAAIFELRKYNDVIAVRKVDMRLTRGEFFAKTFGALTVVAVGQRSLRAQRGGVTDASLGATGEPAAWTRFLGPNGTGVAPGGGYPTIGPSTLAWKRPLPMGKSSPVLTDKHIFLTAQRDTTPLVICLDKRTGELLWERAVQTQRQRVGILRMQSRRRPP